MSKVPKNNWEYPKVNKCRSMKKKKILSLYNVTGFFMLAFVHLCLVLVLNSLICLSLIITSILQALQRGWLDFSLLPITTFLFKAEM